MTQKSTETGVPMPILGRSSYKIGRTRLLIFRLFAALLLLFSIAGVISVGIGTYITIKNDEAGWIPAIFLFILAMTMTLLVAVSVRAIRIGSVDEIEEQNKLATMERIAAWLRK